MGELRKTDNALQQKLGRPPGSTRTSDRELYVTTWLRNIWARENVDWDPKGDEINGVIPILNWKRDVFPLAATLLQEKGFAPFSPSAFKRIWTKWMKENRIRMRRKGNVSGKCSGKISFDYLYSRTGQFVMSWTSWRLMPGRSKPRTRSPMIDKHTSSTSAGSGDSLWTQR